MMYGSNILIMNFLMANYLPDSTLCPFSRALNMYMLMHDSGKGIIYGTLCVYSTN